MDGNKFSAFLKKGDREEKQSGLAFESVKAFLDAKKIVYDTNDTHYQANCFICDETRHRLGIHKETDQWHCFNCGAKGKSLKTLIYSYENKDKVNQKRIRETARQSSGKKPKQKLTDADFEKYHKLIKKTKKYTSLDYVVKTRGLSEEAVEHFKLGAKRIFKDKDGNNYDAGEHLVIPYLVENKCVNMKYRSLDPEVDKRYKWRREKGGETVLFNNDVLLEVDYDEIIIAEAELDCISIWCMGYKNVIGMTAGADAFQDVWYMQLDRFKKIYLLLDGDEAGQDGAKKIAKRLGLDRCYNILLPEDAKDPNDFLLKYGAESFPTLLQSARQFEVPDVKSVKDGFDDILKDIDESKKTGIKGFNTPWERINEKLGPVRAGHLVIVCGKPKAGKTSFVLNWANYLAKNCNTVVGMYTCEMKVSDLTWKLATQNTVLIETNYKEATKLELMEAKMSLPKGNMHFYYPQLGDLELEKVVEKIIEMVQRYGIKFFVFDNLHFLCRGEDEKTMIDKATQTFKVLAENLGITIVLLTHPKKVGSKNISNDDLKGSSSIFQDADSVILLNRRVTSENNENEEEEFDYSLCRADFIITARFHSGGRTHLAFSGDRGLFTESGWLYKKVNKKLKESEKDKKEKGKK